MGRRRFALVIGSTVMVVSVGLILPTARPQTRGTAKAQDGIETATQDRLDDSAWWPTKGDAPRANYVGRVNCARCHVEESREQPLTPMARAGQVAGQSETFRKNTNLNFTRQSTTFTIESAGSIVNYSVTDGQTRFTRPLEWVFGMGVLGQTFLYQSGGRWYESEVSFYSHLNELGITPGHGTEPHAELKDVLGKELSTVEAQRCFGCHTTEATIDHDFRPQEALDGITCEGCHGPGLQHVTKMSGPIVLSNSSASSPAIVNPGYFSPVDSVDFCGACHRTWADIAFAQNPGTDVVRFQPYRLEKSRCWGRNGDARITCVACHNPHEPLQRDDILYDKQCLSCHKVQSDKTKQANQTGKACPVAAGKCVSCHMPKVAVASMHGTFTDHFIRVVRPGEQFPR